MDFLFFFLNVPLVIYLYDDNIFFGNPVICTDFVHIASTFHVLTFFSRSEKSIQLGQCVRFNVYIPIFVCNCLRTNITTTYLFDRMSTQSNTRTQRKGKPNSRYFGMFETALAQNIVISLLVCTETLLDRRVFTHINSI